MPCVPAAVTGISTWCLVLVLRLVLPCRIWRAMARAVNSQWRRSAQTTEQYGAFLRFIVPPLLAGRLWSAMQAVRYAEAITPQTGTGDLVYYLS